MNSGHGLKIKRLSKRIISINGERVKLYQINGLRLKCFYNNVVIKFDEGSVYDYNYDSYYNQSTKEINVWKKIEKHHKKYFAKLLGWNSKTGYVIQEKIKFKKGRKADACHEIIQKMEDYYGISDLAFGSKNDNWGVRENGTPVIYDWGV